MASKVKAKAKATSAKAKKKAAKKKQPKVDPVGGVTLPTPEQTQAAAPHPEPAVAAAAAFVPAAPLAVVPGETALLYNPGETATSGDHRLEAGITEVPESVAHLLVGPQDSKTGTLSKRGVTRLYHSHHPKSVYNDAFKLEADEIGGRFNEKNSEDARMSHAKRAMGGDRG